jgi:hypothetical protein
MDIPQNAVTKLRIMTRKSKFSFGKFKDETVENVLKLHKAYIAFCYYSIESISFADDILDELKIARIPKPGKDEEALREHQREVSKQYTREERFHGWMKRKNIMRKMDYAQKTQTDHEVFETKGAMQRRNQGH